METEVLTPPFESTKWKKKNNNNLISNWNKHKMNDNLKSQMITKPCILPWSSDPEHSRQWHSKLAPVQTWMEKNEDCIEHDNWYLRQSPSALRLVDEQPPECPISQPQSRWISPLLPLPAKKKIYSPSRFFLHRKSLQISRIRVTAISF